MECILLVPDNIKNEVIKKVREGYYQHSIKFMSLTSFKKKVIFDYDEKTLYYVMKKFNLSYDTALLYLDNLYYIDDNMNTPKMKKLIEIKDYLDSNNLLYYDKRFKEYALSHDIYLYGYDNLGNYDLKILNDYNYHIVDNITNTYNVDKIYYANFIEDEVIYVSNKIVSLIINGIDINNIKVVAPSLYYKTMKRIFSFFHIPLKVDKNDLYSIISVKDAINNLNDLSYLDKIKDDKIRKKILSTINKYYFIEDKNDAKELIINDLKSTYVEENDIYSIYDYFSDDDYVFLMGFNKEIIPPVYKDNDYFNDKEKKLLGLDTSISLNKKEHERVKRKILSIKNLTISYMLNDNDNSYTKSDIIDAQSSIIINNDYHFSNTMNMVFLCEKLDKLIKYNIKEQDIEILFKNYDINYQEYDNKFKGINKDDFNKYLDGKLMLSYTHLDNYNRCKFKYYLSNVLKINILKNDFAIIIGNICHYLLSCINNDDFDLDKYFANYINKERKFTKRELFFLNNIKEEISFIIDTLRKQIEYSSLDKELNEEKVFVNIKKNIKVTFMGVIDKVKYKEIDGVTYLVIIDYKTGNTEIKLDNMDYGIGIQLPIYLYLSKYMKFDRPKVIGFYLQKLLVTSLDNKKDYIDAKEDSLKLEGYSIDNENLLSMFDNTYTSSKLIKGMKTSSKGFYSYSKVLSEEEINDLIKKTDRIINETVDEILTCDFEINPKVIDGDNVSCTYCPFRDVCFRTEKDLIYINTRKDNE